VASPSAGIDALLSRNDFPVPNLIPPAIVVRRAVWKAKRRILIAVFTVLAVLLGLFVLGKWQLATANVNLRSAEQLLNAAEAQKAEYAEVPAVYAAVEAARRELAQAMGNEVQVARLVSELAVIMPPSVSLTEVSMTIGEEATAGAPPQAPAGEELEPVVGTASFSGEASSFNDVSAWIDTLRGNPDYQNVILTDVSRDSTNGIFIFTNTAELTDQALSGRFVEGEQ
jgi:Tfp pilus assembly protein PilN